MKVRIYAQRENGPQELGAIVLKDGTLIPEPKIPVLTNILRDPLFFYEQDEEVEVSAAKEPNKFLQALPKCVRGSYLWAGPVEE